MYRWCIRGASHIYQWSDNSRVDKGLLMLWKRAAEATPWRLTFFSCSELWGIPVIYGVRINWFRQRLWKSEHFHFQTWNDFSTCFIFGYTGDSFQNCWLSAGTYSWSRKPFLEDQVKLWLFRFLFVLVMRGSCKWFVRSSCFFPNISLEFNLALNFSLTVKSVLTFQCGDLFCLQLITAVFPHPSRWTTWKMSMWELS